MEQPQPGTGEVLKRAGKLKAMADKVGVATVSAAASSATTALIEMALAGTFGWASGRIGPRPAGGH